MALGHEATGIMGNDDDLVHSVLDAGEQADEPLWQLPLWDVHKDQVKSKFADIANLNSPAHGNGSTAGGAFLSFFVGDTKWVHLDIAGTAWGQRARGLLPVWRVRDRGSHAGALGSLVALIAVVAASFSRMQR